MKTLFGHLKDSTNNSSLSATYHIGLLQTKANKAIMGRTSEILSKVNVSNVDWVAMGTLMDHPNGLRPLELSEILGVEQPFITVVASKLSKRGYVEVFNDTTDKRAKILHITKAGKAFIKSTEKMLAKEMEKISTGITHAEAMTYFKVLKQIVDYSEKNK